jgi:hypothetical protein
LALLSSATKKENIQIPTENSVVNVLDILNKSKLEKIRKEVDEWNFEIDKDETDMDISFDDLEELDLQGSEQQLDMTVASTLNNQPSSAMKNGKLNDSSRSKKRAEEVTRERNKGKPNGLTASQ